MYERFSDRARKVMQLANQAAQKLNHEYVGTEHILMGLVRENAGVAAMTLKNLGVDSGKVDEEINKVVQPVPELVTMGKLPHTPRAKTIIEFAMEEARTFGHGYVGTEHILLGLIRQTEGIAGLVLRNMGVTLDSARHQVLSLLGTPRVMPSVPESHREHSEWSPVIAACRHVNDITAGMAAAITAMTSHKADKLDLQASMEFTFDVSMR